MTVVDVVANGLAYEVIGNGEAREAMVREQLPFFGDVLFRRRRGIDVDPQIEWWSRISSGGSLVR